MRSEEQVQLVPSCLLGFDVTGLTYFMPEEHHPNNYDLNEFTWQNNNYL